MAIDRGAESMRRIEPARRMTGFDMDSYNRDLLRSLGFSSFWKYGDESEQGAEGYQTSENLGEVSASRFHFLRIVSYAAAPLKTRSIASSAGLT
jgi:hypothetical protein